MNRVELHPEGLLERARMRIASPEEMERLEAHLVSCKACAFEHAVAADCDRANAPRPNDDVVLARVRDRTLQVLAARSHRRPVRRVSRRFLMFAAAAAVLLIGTCAVAARFVHYFRWRGSDRPTPPRSALLASPADEAPPPLPLPVRSESSSPAPAAEPLSLGAPSAEHQPVAMEKEQRNAARSARSSPERTGLPQPSTTPNDLFARANVARRSGDIAEAARLYRELQRSFPGSVEELVSRVTLGRMLLDRLGDANGSLVQFDSYLRNPSHRSLLEEALIGRALALGRLGRLAEERAAWTALLAAYPASAYSERARARLAGR